MNTVQDRLLARAQASEKSANPSREDWLDEALKLLAGGGLAAVTIDALCLRLKRSKGSFYWHFAGRQGLLQDMAQRWADSFSQDVFEEVRARDISDLEKLREVGRLTREHGYGNIDRAMRIRADSCDYTADAVRRADKAILEFSTECLSRAGVETRQVRRIARLCLVASVGYFATSPSLGKQTDEEINQLLHQLVEASR